MSQQQMAVLGEQADLIKGVYWLMLQGASKAAAKIKNGEPRQGKRRWEQLRERSNQILLSNRSALYKVILLTLQVNIFLNIKL